MRSVFRLAPTIFLASAVAASSLLGACGRDDTVPTTPSNNSGKPGIVAGTLDARAARPTLTLRNTTEFVVGYMVVDKDQMVVALYPPCGATCPQLRQGASIALPYSAIAGYTAASTEARVLWWTYAPRADGTLQPQGGVQTISVRLD